VDDGGRTRGARRDGQASCDGGAPAGPGTGRPPARTLPSGRETLTG
jgi:hypothetical protein